MTIQASSHLLIVDPSVEHYQELLSSVADGFDVVFLQPTEDGIHQITSALATRVGLQTLHILSHGSPGNLLLGDSCLNRYSLNRYSTAITQWSHAFAAKAEIFLYGCQVAQTPEGQRFVNLLSELTGATIAASQTLTGSAHLGGTWDLAYRTAPIHTPLAFSEPARSAYPAVLVAAVPNLLYGVVNAGFTTSQIFEIDTQTGTAQQVGQLQDTRAGAPSPNILTFAIARVIDPITQRGLVYFIESGTGSRRVGFWDPSNGQTTILSNVTVPVNSEFLKMAQNQNGTIFAKNVGENILYIVDAATGALSQFRGAGTVTNLPSGSGDMAFDPDNPNRLIISSLVGGQLQLFSVDISSPTLTATQLGTGSALIGGTGIGSLAFGPDGNLYLSSTSGTVRRIFRVDKTTGAVTPEPIAVVDTSGANLPGDLTDFGSLPSPTQSVNIDVRIGDQLPDTVQAGERITFTLLVRNTDPNLDASGIQVLSNLPGQLTNITWTAQITSGVGGFPGASSGSGSTINNLVNLNSNAVVTYTVQATVAPGTPENTRIQVTATALPPRGLLDRDLSNNTLVDTTLVVDDDNNGGSGGCVPGTPINGNAGNNRLVGRNGIIDTIRGGAGRDTLLGLGCPDRLFGNSGSDVLDGGAANDTLEGGGGRDRLLGQAGNDILRGGNGNDTLLGGNGNDVLSGHSGNDNLAGGNGRDRLDGGGENDVLSGGAGNDNLRGGGGNDNANGDDGNDSIFGDAGNDSLRGNNGNDTIEGGEGNDRLRGDRGADILRGGNGNDIVIGGADRDLLFGDAGNDLLNGITGNDILRGALGNDSLVGGEGNDILSGNSGADLLDGVEGRDRLNGGGGNDTLFGGDGNDNLLGSTGDDSMECGAGNDLARGGVGNDQLLGDAGLDRLFGDAGNDSMNGGADNDILQGALGNDTLLGGNDNDYLSGNSGNDVLDGGTGADRLNGGGGNDTLTGGADNDVLQGSTGDDDLNGSDGDDRILGQGNNDLIRGGAGQDTLFGQENNDDLRGNVGNDVLQGGGGRDTLFGQEDNDLIIGGANGDALVGGAGSDTFLFTAPPNGPGAFADSVASDPDQVPDFNQTLGDRFQVRFASNADPTLPTAMFNAGTITAGSLVAAARSVFGDRNGQAAGSPALGARQAVLFIWQQQTFLGINNDQGAYTPSQDVIANVTSNIIFKPGDANLPVLNVSDYFV